MSRGTLGSVALLGLLSVTAHYARLGGRAALAEDEGAPEPQAAPDEEATDPLGPNAACYMCHIPFVREELSREHLRAEITCLTCHGPSAGHVNDEDIGATKPDITYEREGVNAYCRLCHEDHDVPPEDVVARWLERKLTTSPPVCTDCHGTHKIEASGESEEAEDDRAGTTHG
ncbi:MAG: cytochrome c3 family protein [Armatimonadota bacterium]